MATCASVTAGLRCSARTMRVTASRLRRSAPLTPRAAAPPPRRLLLAFLRIASNRRIEAPSRLHDPPDERDVVFFDFPIVELPRKLFMCPVVLGDAHQS